MVVRTTRGIENRTITANVSERHMGMIRSLYVNIIKTWKLYPVHMENIEESMTPLFIYSFLLWIGVLPGVYIMHIIISKDFNIVSSMVACFWFVFVSIFYSFLAAYVYRTIISKIIDTHYISYVYVVLLSTAHCPFILPLTLILNRTRSIFTILLASISQFIISSSMLRGYSIESSRKAFVFHAAEFVFQWTFIFGTTSRILKMISSP